MNQNVQRSYSSSCQLFAYSIYILHRFKAKTTFYFSYLAESSIRIHFKTAFLERTNFLARWIFCFINRASQLRDHTRLHKTAGLNLARRAFIRQTKVYRFSAHKIYSIITLLGSNSCIAPFFAELHINTRHALFSFFCQLII